MIYVKLLTHSSIDGERYKRFSEEDAEVQQT